jgi:hypothetical protein
LAAISLTPDLSLKGEEALSGEEIRNFTDSKQRPFVA